VGKEEKEWYFGLISIRQTSWNLIGENVKYHARVQIVGISE